MSKQTLALHVAHDKKLRRAMLPIEHLEASAMYELTRSKKHLSAAALHIFELLRRA